MRAVTAQVSRVVSVPLVPRPPEDSEGAGLSISVIFTSVRSTLAALKTAGELASQLGARIRLLVPQIVPHPLSLENPPVAVEFNEARFRVLASKCAVATHVQILLCRDPYHGLKSVLRRGSIVVMSGRRGWWRLTHDERMANRLRRAGCEVVFNQTE